MKTGIIISARVDSSRIPQKIFAKINGIYLIEHLINRLKKTGFPIYIAIPSDQKDQFEFIKKSLNVELYCGSKDDVLHRILSCAEFYQLDRVIRITCDKVLIDPATICEAVEYLNSSDTNVEFLHSSDFTDGSRFEIFTTEVLRRASLKHRNIEHLTYAVSSVTDKKHNYQVSPKLVSKYRFLIDYPEDLTLMNLIFSSLGNDCTLSMAIGFMWNNPWAVKINYLPEITIYTCAKNAEKYIQECMGSVSSQTRFKDSEYILIDDFSDDNTTRFMAKFSTLYKNVKFIRNQSNIGIAGSSNLALERARGSWIIRLDADDYFLNPTAISQLITFAGSNRFDAIYPHAYVGNKNIQFGFENHHIGGSLFNTRAINTFKFTDGLRGYDGFDFFERSKNSIRTGYYNHPIFYYRQHNDSLCKNNLNEREGLKKSLAERNTHE